MIDILRGWRDWDLPFAGPPDLVRELEGGRTNQSYLIEAGERLWVLRISAPNHAYLGIDREREAAILTRAVAAGIAPPVAYCCASRGILITEYVDGDTWSPDVLRDPEYLERLLNLIRRVHDLDVTVAPLDYYAHAERYWQRLIDLRVDIPDELAQERERLLAGRGAYPCVWNGDGLCHHDLTPQNIVVRDDRLYLLDWEYAAVGSRAFDYAAFTVEWNVSLEYIHDATGIGQSELEHARDLYEYTCRLWGLLNGVAA